MLCGEAISGVGDRVLITLHFAGRASIRCPFELARAIRDDALYTNVMANPSAVVERQRARGGVQIGRNSRSFRAWISDTSGVIWAGRGGKMDGALGSSLALWGWLALPAARCRLLHRRLTPTLLRSRATQPRHRSSKRSRSSAIRRFKVSAYPLNQMPANVQTADAADMQRRQTLDLARLSGTTTSAA